VEAGEASWYRDAMGADAIALLRGTNLPVPTGTLLKTLDDAVLVFTLTRFSADLESMALAVRLRLGDALDAHRDKRGVFLFPDVAEPLARTYEGVITEVGQAGAWAPIVAADHVPSALGNAPEGSLAAVMGELMGAIGGDLRAELMKAMATGDPSAMPAIKEKLVAAMGGQEQADALASRLTAAAAAEQPAYAAAMKERLARAHAISAARVAATLKPKKRPTKKKR
jgi:hypothetical protein